MSSKNINPRDLKPGPIRRASLQPELTLRIEVTRTTLAEVFPISADEWLDGFLRDLHPELEIAWWERVARCYTGFTTRETLTDKQKRAVFKIIFGVFSGVEAKDLASDMAELSEALVEELLAICAEHALLP
jgi:hypothetical protein